MGNPLRKYPPLPAAGCEDSHPLSYQQERLYYLSLILPDSSVWNLVSSYTLSGSLQAAAMEQAVYELAARHPVLRSEIGWRGKAPYQSFSRQAEELFAYSDLTAAPNGGGGQALQALLEQLWYEPIRLNGEDRLFQAVLFRTEADKYVMSLKAHHIIADGTSLQILWRDLKRIYNALLLGVPADLPPLKLDYGSYVSWQRDSFAEELTTDQETYWLKEFQGELPVLDLPADFPPPAQLSFNGALTRLELPEDMVSRLRVLCMKNRVMLFSGLMAVFYVLLHKVAGQEDIVAGTVFSGRHYGQEFNHPAGFFVNTVAVRMKVNGRLTFTDLLKNVHQKVDDAYYMQDYPFERLIRTLNPDRNDNRIPLFRTMFNMVSEGAEELEFLGLEERKLESDANATQTDLLFDIRQEGSRTFLWAEYNTGLFREDTVNRLLGMYLNLLDQMVSSPEAKVKDLVLTSPQEQEHILTDFNDTAAPYPSELRIHELFAEQVRRQPERTVLCYGERQWTYSQLDQEADRLAVRLQGQGAGPDRIVGILAGRSPELVIGLLGILKTGAAYLPIDPLYPEERNRFMLEDSGACMLLVQSGLDTPPEWKWKTLVLDGQAAEDGTSSGSGGMTPGGHDPMDRGRERCPEQLAYVMYTSGSTGVPKGVMVLHRNVVRLVHDGGFLELQPEDRLLLTGSPSFDAVTYEIWGTLLNGIPLYLAGDDTLLNPGRLGAFIRENGISLLWLTAALFQQLAEADPGLFAPLRYLLVGGDQLPVRQVGQVMEACPDLHMLNMYGPTENTTFSTCYAIEGKHDTGIPIGKPVPNSTAYILDAYGHVQPVGIPGELYVGGDGLAGGYLNRPELTAERFLPAPFSPEQRIYKTGDRAKWLPDGNIAFLGRLDHQVKIRGYRVEPGEIETSLLTCSAVAEAAVIAREDREGSKYLCAYVVCTGASTVSDVREFLIDRLPGYMVPSVIVPLSKLPVTRNGKIDRRQLPVPSVHESGAPFREAVTGVEQQLAEIWREVLDRSQVGADDHFFACGGHSLKAMVLMSRINWIFQVELPLREIFQAPTLSQMAARIEALQQEQGRREASPLAFASPLTHSYPASASQNRMYVLNQLLPGGIEYNVPLVLKAEGALDAGRLEEALNRLLLRHEPLRTSFHMLNGELVQRIAEGLRLRVEYREAADEAEAREQVQAWIRPFELSQAPLVRAGLIEIRSGGVLLLLDIHHIVTDGVSSGLILRELNQLYGGAATAELPEGKVQYKDYAVWERNRLRSEAVREQEAYWLDKLQGELPVLNLLPDYPRPPVQSFEGDRITFRAERQLYERLKITAAETGTTLYMILLAGYQVLLSKYSGQEDILVGTPIAGRQHADVQNMIGLFVNTLVLRGYPRSGLSFREFLLEVKAEALGAYGHQETPFEDLVEKVQSVRDMSRNPLFDTMFTLQNTESRPLVLDGVAFSETEFAYPVSKFDLTLTALEGEQGLRLEWEYAVRLFKRTTIARMAEHYIHILNQVTENPDLQLSGVELVMPQERERILETFNDTAASYPSELCIHELFAEQARRMPDRIALLFGHETLTYGELHERSSVLARKLLGCGVKPGDILAVIAERSLDMVIGIYAILKAGAAYLPIDPGTPRERILYMLEDSGTCHVLLQRPEHSALAGGEVTCHVISHLLEDTASEEREWSPAIPLTRPEELAYIIYTSGSTGKPKGVMIEHRSLLNTLWYLQDAYPLTAEDTYLFKTAFTFDVSATELFGWFFQGGRLAILAPGLEREPLGIVEAVTQHQVTHMNFSPSMLEVFLQAVDRKAGGQWQGVKYIFAAGEALKPHVVESFYSMVSGVRLENIYGPTEITIYATAYSTEVPDRQGSIAIGKPISNMKAYIVDRHLRLQPPGVAGELCLSGTGLARGYLNQAEMTKEKFVISPFNPLEKMYRTGDLARLRDDGNIEYLGRLDQQVKVRGYRIEPGEIEQTLLGHPDILNAVVAVKEGPADNRRLLAYLVLREEGREDDWAGYLRRWLPSYMIPEAFIHLREIPLNASGKADLKMLPDSSGDRSVPFTEPRTPQEIRLARLIGELLGAERLGMSDSLFDHGANSITLVQLAMLLEDEFQTSVSIMELLAAPTAAAISAKISLAETAAAANILL